MGIWTKRTSCDYRKKGKCETEFHTVVRDVVKKGRFCDTFEKQKGWNLYYVHWQLPGTLVITGVKWEEHTCTHAHILAYWPHMYTHTNMYACMHTHPHACTHTCMRYACTHTWTCTPTCRMSTWKAHSFSCSQAETAGKKVWHTVSCEVVNWKSAIRKQEHHPWG